MKNAHLCKYICLYGKLKTEKILHSNLHSFHIESHFHCLEQSGKKKNTSHSVWH